ncbi:HAD hydrolase-like protein [Aureimonas phyllosphaerae]|uniref:phosphoglycolate phosphatase n=1 Tax=Aureimonas phyllosphaerae TaxID=1166078 RepID=A0A7W6FTM7_9HYPH|nr:HAD hydrolase-like protein [Aureimonas phyllosphaerae]MBB3935193.1 phosphoglycolate phosphatase [Aureimonas phyllosphaerae]MBB3959201.1 phosphoglycolate phosphatase [Aureimonas phyllosphaerae]SFF06587.1 phosphoglycolate phosphatase [Aureimonas phyllosphaerae]
MSVVRSVPLARPVTGPPARRTLAKHERALDGATVVFDLDGTLVDTAPDLTGALNHCLASAGLSATTLDSVRPQAGHGAKAMLTAAYMRADRPLGDAELTEQTARFLAYYGDHIAVSSTLFPGALATLDRMADAGATLAVCTNKTEALAIRLLRELRLADRFAAICGADTFMARKPDPVHLSGTIALAGGRIDCAVMIGDTDTDIEAAKRLGLPSILLGFGYDADRIAREKATAVVSHFDEIDVALVDRLIR